MLESVLGVMPEVMAVEGDHPHSVSFASRLLKLQQLSRFELQRDLSVKAFFCAEFADLVFLKLSAQRRQYEENLSEGARESRYKEANLPRQHDSRRTKVCYVRSRNWVMTTEKKRKRRVGVDSVTTSLSFLGSSSRNRIHLLRGSKT